MKNKKEIIPVKYENLKKIFTKKEIFTIPNFLSAFRLVLAVLLFRVHRRLGLEEGKKWMVFILVLSALSDFLDGKIARKFNMVSEIGKIIDPIADKVTQGVLLLCLLPRYQMAPSIFLLFLIKEGFMLVEGSRTVVKTGRNEGAKWYGKVSTAVFYGVMLILNLFPNINKKAANILLGISGAFMLLSFVMYVREFRSMRKQYDLGA